MKIIMVALIVLASGCAAAPKETCFGSIPVGPTDPYDGSVGWMPDFQWCDRPDGTLIARRRSAPVTLAKTGEKR